MDASIVSAKIGYLGCWRKTARSTAKHDGDAFIAATITPNLCSFIFVPAASYNDRDVQEKVKRSMTLSC